MVKFYHELTTKKSFEILRELQKKFDFILIGGWAIFMYTEVLESKDIRIIIDFGELKKIRDEYEISKNQRLKKYEIKIEEVDIDIYTPFFSELGFPTEEINKYTQQRQGFLVPYPEILLILKVVTYKDRKGSSKGKKDLIDIFSLLSKTEINWERYHDLIEDYELESINESFVEIVKSADAIPELDLLNHRIAKLKEKVLGNLQL